MEEGSSLGVGWVLPDISHLPTLGPLSCMGRHSQLPKQHSKAAAEHLDISTKIIWTLYSETAVQSALLLICCIKHNCLRLGKAAA